MADRFELMTEELLRDIHEALYDVEGELAKEVTDDTPEAPEAEWSVVYAGKTGNRLFSKSQLPEGRRALRVAQSVIKLLHDGKLDDQPKDKIIEFLVLCLKNA